MICTIPACTAHFGCQLRAKSVQVSPAATPNRVAARPPVMRPMREPSWEKGIAGEHRVDGSFMPYLRPGTTSPMPIKEYAEQRSVVEAGVKRLKSDPHVFQPKE